ncbi:MAG TPA: filamentous hemagglutinin N-terminal domain-containing protein [Caulobacteraceae bacterium]
MIALGRPRAQRRFALLLCAAAVLGMAEAASAAVLPLGPKVAGATSGAGATFNYGSPNSLTIDQSAARVVIDWRSFSIGAGGTVNFNQASPDWIAFNRVNIDPATGLSPLSTISGALNAKGGVWLFSTGGILFGPTAAVNVGSFAGVTAPLSAAGGIAQLLYPDGAGFTTVMLDPPIGAGVETITVQHGAQINAASGYVILQGETMVQDGALAAFDGVDYTVGETGQILFTTTSGGQQLQSASASAVAGRDRPSFSHGGSTTAAWVGIDAPGGALQAGYRALINLDGVIQASGVKPGTSGEGVVLLVGDDAGPAYPGYTGSSIGLDASGGAIDAANGLAITSDSAKLGRVTLGGPLSVLTYGDISTTSPISAGGAALLASAAGAVTVGADVTASGSISAAGQRIAVGPEVTLRSDAMGQTGGGIVLTSAGDVTADPSSSLVAGVDAAAPTGNVTVRAGGGPQGGNIVLGRISGARVFVQSNSQTVAGQGAITLAGDIEGTLGVNVLVNDVNAAGSSAGGLSILGAVTSTGFLDVENLGTGAFVIGPGARLTSSGGQVFLYAGGDTTVSPGAQITGVSILDHTLGLLTIASGASLTTTGSAPAPIGPVIPAGSDFQRGSGLNLAAANIDIQGSVTAGRAAAPDDIYIEVLGPAGATAVIGGPGGGSGFDLSNASFAALSARNIVIMGGPGEASGPGGSLEIQNLTLDSSRLSALWLGTASSQAIRIAGAVSRTGGGPVDLQIGFARFAQTSTSGEGAAVSSPSGGLDGFIPGEIDISGGLGSPLAPLNAVNLIARNDILIGEANFIAAAQADPAFDAFRSSAAYPGFTQDQVFIASQSLQLASMGRVIQQNTGADSLLFAGLEIGAPAAAQPLVYAPQALQNQAIAGGVWTANYSQGPSRVDLFGALALSGGRTVDDSSAATQPNLLDTSIATRAAYRINGCVFGALCPSTAGTSTFEPPQAQQIEVAVAGAQDLVGAAAGTDVFAVLTTTDITLQQDDQRLGLANPITEIGNGDLSAGTSNECPPKPDPSLDCRRP